MRLRKSLILLLSLLTLFAFVSCTGSVKHDPIGQTSLSFGFSEAAQSVSFSASSEENTSSATEKLLTVHYLDVGQGDSAFIELPNGSCMLIDASESKYGQQIVDSIRALGYERIDYVIATHPHADHIGGMRKVLESFSIGCIYLPDVSANTSTYIKLAETILERDIEAKIAQAGVMVFSDESIALRGELLAPKQINEKDQNQNSAVLLLTYGQNRFLFMGDADTEIENTLGTDVRCDVLKVGHHGSRTASGSAFLAAAKPSYAIISCGSGNSYGHPHTEALERLTQCGATVLRTDLLGTIRVLSDGTAIRVEYDEKHPSQPSESSESQTVSEPVSEASTESKPTDVLWVLNTSTKKIHKPSCRHVKSIAKKNYAESSESLESLLAKGYTACGTCKLTA